MDFEQLRIFLVLAEERTFLGTANRLATSRSRVRRKLEQLESHAGTALVSRVRETGDKKRHLTLTPAGQALAKQGRALLIEAEHLISEIHEIGSEPTGCLAIAMPFAPAPRGWNDLCHHAQTRFPKLRIEFLYDERPSQLIPTRAELAVTFEDQLPKRCTRLDMGEFTMRLVASKAYLEQYGLPQSVEGLGVHRIAAWRNPGRPVDRIPLRVGPHLEIKPQLISVEPRVLQQRVLADDCIGYLPALPSLDDPALEVLFADQVCETVHQSLAVPDLLADLPRVRHFVDLCRLELCQPITAATSA